MGAATLLKAGQADAAAGRAVEAERRYREALDVEPALVAAHLELGHLLLALNRNDEASHCFETAMRAGPVCAETIHSLGAAYVRAGRFEEAGDCFRRALSLRPGYADAHNSYGSLLRRSGDAAGAHREYAAAVAADPHGAASRLNLAVSLKDAGRYEEACRECGALLEHAGDHVEARYTLGSALLAIGRTEDALAEFERAVRLSPNHDEARYSTGVALLKLERYRAGWEAYEWRLRRSGVRQRDFKRPRWDGRTPLEGKRLLVHSEQNAIETILFARFARNLKDRGAFVIVECQPSLSRLMASAPGVDAVVETGTVAPRFDLQVPLLSLPFSLGIEKIPAPLSYLSANQEQVKQCSERLAAGGRPRIGLCWEGDPPPGGVGAETIPLPAAADDYSEIAAIIGNLDLVISSDTPTAHLAGALGCPVWMMLDCGCGFYWLQDREDSPWYPRARLFRQSRPGGWEEPAGRIQAALQLPGAESVLTRS